MKHFSTSLRRAVVVAALTLIAGVATQKAALAQTWQPYALTGNETTITTVKTLAGSTHLQVKITFYSSAYRVTIPTAYSQDPNNNTLFYINVAAEHYTGASSQVVTTYTQDYDLGVLNPNVTYYFTIYQSLSPTTVKQIHFHG